MAGAEEQVGKVGEDGGDLHSPEDGWMDVLGTGVLVKKVIKEGAGDRPEDKQFIHVHLVGRVLEGEGQALAPRDAPFQDTSKGEPICFQAGDTHVRGICTGLTLAARLMQPGEKSAVRLLASRFGYGQDGDADLGVPGDAKLEYEVEMVKLGEVEPDGDLMTQEQAERYGGLRKSQGNELHKAGDYDAALVRYQQGCRLLQAVQHDTPAIRELRVHCHNNRGTTLEALGRLTEAKEAYVEALLVDPHNYKALIRAATIAIDQNHFEEATLALERAKKVKDTALVRARVRDLRQKKKLHQMKEVEMFKGWADRGGKSSSSDSNSNPTESDKSATSAQSGGQKGTRQGGEPGPTGGDVGGDGAEGGGEEDVPGARPWWYMKGGNSWWTTVVKAALVQGLVAGLAMAVTMWMQRGTELTHPGHGAQS